MEKIQQITKRIKKMCSWVVSHLLEGLDLEWIVSESNEHGDTKSHRFFI